MRRRCQSQRFDPIAEETVDVYERARGRRWILVDSFECRVRVRRMTCGSKGVRS